MADWNTISALATGGGTLVLAFVTYASVKSANRAARVAEASLLAQLRPLIVGSGDADPAQRVNFGDISGIAVPGGRAALEVVDDRIYLVVSLRNVGSGIAVLHGGYVHPQRPAGDADHAPLDAFRLLTRDIYVPPGEVGFWQTAWRDGGAPADLLAAIENGTFAVEVLYGDFEGHQRAITRVGLTREEDGAWHLSTVRHWQVTPPG